MATLQPGIAALGARAHHYLEFDLAQGANLAEVRSIAAAGLSDARATNGGVNIVVGFRGSLWAEIDGSASSVDDFAGVSGPDGFTMPATQHDVWVWISGATNDVVFDAARAVGAAFAPVASLASERTGFTYRDSRDLSGFVDGTENPPITEVPELLTIPDDTPGAGGTIVFVQRWIHDLEAFHAHSVEEQERIIGRTKFTDEELPDDVKPESAHIARTVIEDDDGEELEIFRRSAPYGDVSECGLMFVAFTPEVGRLRAMLDNMVGTDGIRDALTEWSTPVSGGFYFVPPLEALF